MPAHFGAARTRFPNSEALVTRTLDLNKKASQHSTICIAASTRTASVAHYCRTQRAKHSFWMVLIEVMVNVSEAGEPILAKASELVLIEGDSVPVTSTCCPK